MPSVTQLKLPGLEEILMLLVKSLVIQSAIINQKPTNPEFIAMIADRLRLMAKREKREPMYSVV